MDDTPNMKQLNHVVGEGMNCHPVEENLCIPGISLYCLSLTLE